jgi:HK97 gp10 family phage protein
MSDKTDGVIGLDELQRKFDDLNRVVSGADLRNLLLAMAQVFVRAIQEKIKERGLIDSGRLRASVEAQALDDRNVIVGVLNLVYAAIHEFGGVIQAKDGGLLRFRTKDGQWHAVKEVTIPARPYMRPAFFENIDKAIETFGSLLIQHFERIAKS